MQLGYIYICIGSPRMCVCVIYTFTQSLGVNVVGLGSKMGGNGKIGGVADSGEGCQKCTAGYNSAANLDGEMADGV